MPPMVNVNGDAARWRLLRMSYDSVFKNLALEETLARVRGFEATRPTVRFWTNVPSVVLGRFQEASSEVDLALCESLKVEVARRFTGGGAVFHDKGTLNFTITTGSEIKPNLSAIHEEYSAVVVDSLKTLGIESSFSPPNSILVDERKVFGAAAALGNHFTLWHGSLLVSTDIQTLGKVLAPSRREMPNGFVRSQWRPVTTIESVLGRRVSVEELQTHLSASLQERFGVGVFEDDLLPSEENHLQGIFAQKYALPEWNLYGNRFRSENKESVE